MKSSLIGIAVAMALSPHCRASPLVARDDEPLVSIFDKLTPSSQLQWTPCYMNFTCALLEVPLDYSNTSAGTTNLAIIKSPGETEDAREVLYNPGGPGGSSVEGIMFGMPQIQGKIGTKYSLVGIDPRGVANSGPSSDCFPGFSHIARNSFLADVNSIPDATSDYTLAQNHKYMEAYGKWCSSIYAVNQTAKYAGTVATAQDMLHYIELSAAKKGEDPKQAKLSYYGTSYGSLLGGTFASLYPDRIDRMILDGVMDMEDHFNGGWETSIVDNDEATRNFFKKCFEAGPALCQFHQNATSWEELEGRYWTIFDNLKYNPVAVGTLQESLESVEAGGPILTPSLVDWQSLADVVFGTLYMLNDVAYVQLDTILTAIEKGNYQGASTVPAKAWISSPTILETFPSKQDERVSRFLINCLDANRRFNTSEFGQYKEFVQNMDSKSRYGGLKASTYSGPICSHLDVQAPESQQFDGVPRMAATSAPILLVSTLLDPITPLAAARKMHLLLPGSGLLVANNSGHCAHFQKSTCISKWEMQYMAEGTLPPPNTLCEVDQPNFFIPATNATSGGN